MGMQYQYADGFDHGHMFLKFNLENVDAAVNDITLLLYTREAELERWNEGGEKFVRRLFGGGNDLRADRIAEIVRRVEEWLERRGVFKRADNGKWIWNVDGGAV